MLMMETEIAHACKRNSIKRSEWLLACYTVEPWASYRGRTGHLNGGADSRWPFTLLRRHTARRDPRHSPSHSDRPGLISLSGNTAVLSPRSEENFCSVIRVSQLPKHRQTPQDTFSLCNTPFSVTLHAHVAN